MHNVTHWLSLAIEHGTKFDILCDTRIMLSIFHDSKARYYHPLGCNFCKNLIEKNISASNSWTSTLPFAKSLGQITLLTTARANFPHQQYI